MRYIFDGALAVGAIGPNSKVKKRMKGIINAMMFIVPTDRTHTFEEIKKHCKDLCITSGEWSQILGRRKAKYKLTRACVFKKLR